MGVSYTLLEEEHTARTRGEEEECRYEPQREHLWSPQSKTELEDLCKSLSIPTSGYETEPHVTRKIKEAQAQRVPFRQETLDVRRHWRKTFE